MPVAKSFQSFAIFGEPYIKNGRQYVVVVKPNGGHREVRWYTEAEYAKMYPTEANKDVDAVLGKKIRTTKEVLGFANGYITIFKGDTYALLDWFRESTARYHNIFGWYFISTEELPEIPAGIEPIQLKWEDVAFVDEDTLKSEAVIKEHINSLIYESTGSEWQGAVGDRLELELTVQKVIPLDSGYYGPSIFHLFTDAAGNEYTWTTGSKTLEEGTTYTLRGTVKNLVLYKGSKQTVLTRCHILDKLN